MIDLNAIRADATASEKIGITCEVNPSTILELLDRLEAAEKDAARYRWLRNGNDERDSPAMQIAINSYGYEWDEAIDAAMGEQT